MFQYHCCNRIPLTYDVHYWWTSILLCRIEVEIMLKYLMAFTHLTFTSGTLQHHWEKKIASWIGTPEKTLRNVFGKQKVVRGVY